MDLHALVAAKAPELSRSERRVAELVAAAPDAVAFGTVAELASRTNTSPATVVRAAGRLGFDGFRGLQEQVRATMTARLAPARAAIRRSPSDDLLGRALAIEAANVASSLAALDEQRFARAADLLAGPGGVWVLAGDATAGIARLVADQLASLRPDVTLCDGNEARVARMVATATRADTALVIELARYERSVVAATRALAARGARVVAVTDGPLSPLAEPADVTCAVAADGVGPFDSHVGTLAVVQALVAGVAARRRAGATRRLDRIEAAWHDGSILTPP